MVSFGTSTMTQTGMLSDAKNNGGVIGGLEPFIYFFCLEYFFVNVLSACRDFIFIFTCG